jgi:regulator of replication initiation timing
MEISDLELIDRYQTVFDRYVALAPKLAELLEEFGRVRRELSSLTQEMHARKLPTELNYPLDVVEDAQKSNTG